MVFCEGEENEGGRKLVLTVYQLVESIPEQVAAVLKTSLKYL